MRQSTLCLCVYLYIADVSQNKALAHLDVLDLKALDIQVVKPEQGNRILNLKACDMVAFMYLLTQHHVLSFAYQAKRRAQNRPPFASRQLQAFFWWF